MDKFDIVLIDFPWKYDVWDEATGGGRTASRHYKTSAVSQFNDLPILDICNKNALLLLWVTYPNLMQLDPVIQAWNERASTKAQCFEYKTILNTWAKLNKRWKETARKIIGSDPTDEALERVMIECFANGNGFYTMANCEIIAVYGRGGLSGNLERMSKSQRNFQAITVMEHSRKPDRFHQIIDTLFPKARKLELFARREYPDPRWTCIGNEISGNDIRIDIAKLQGRQVLELL